MTSLASLNRSISAGQPTQYATTERASAQGSLHNMLQQKEHQCRATYTICYYRRSISAGQPTQYATAERASAQGNLHNMLLLKAAPTTPPRVSLCQMTPL
jgi:hypothetical protein